MDRQTDRQTRCLKGNHSQKVMQRVLVQSQQKKKHVVPIACQKIRQNRSEKIIAVPGSTVTYLGSTENTTFVHLPKKSKYLKADFL